MGFEKGYCPEAERYHKEILSIPIYPTMSEEQQRQVISELKRLLHR